MPDGPGKPDDRHPVRRLRPAEELMRSGERLYYEGEFLLAAREFARARRHDPTLFEVWAEEVDACLRGGDVPGAEEIADEAIDAYGRVPIFYAAKALVLAHQGFVREANQHSDIAVEHDDSRMFTWLSRAEVLLSSGVRGIMHSVEGCFARAAQLDATHWRAKLRAGMALVSWDHPDKAVERLRQVADLRPANPFVWLLLGDCHRRLGDAAMAREAYQIALSRRPSYQPALDALRSMTLWGRLCDRLMRLVRPRRKT
ncbi:tetratricopeptide repeat protein [Planctomycetota bacterium]